MIIRVHFCLNWSVAICAVLLCQPVTIFDSGKVKNTERFLGLGKPRERQLAKPVFEFSEHACSNYFGPYRVTGSCVLYNKYVHYLWRKFHVAVIFTHHCVSSISTHYQHRRCLERK